MRDVKQFLVKDRQEDDSKIVALCSEFVRSRPIPKRHV